MACVAFKFSWRVSPSSFHGVCRLQVIFHWRVSPSQIQACVATKWFLACVAFQVNFLDGRHLHLYFYGVCDFNEVLTFMGCAAF